MGEGSVARDVGDPDAVSQQVRAVSGVVGEGEVDAVTDDVAGACLLYTSPSPRDLSTSRMPSSA